jgi:hypothetical protein
MISMSNPYSKGEWVCLSPLGNAQNKVMTVRRSAITVVVRITPGADSDMHGVAIRCGDAEHRAFFTGDDAAQQADLLHAACMDSNSHEMWSFDCRATEEIVTALAFSIKRGYPDRAELRQVMSMLDGQTYCTIITG